MDAVRHSLTNKNLDTLTAECSQCGLVAMRKAGNGYQCSVKKAEAHASWTEANPEKARVNRRLRSEHLLFNRTATDASCSKCGPVKLVPWGRGQACENLAAERRTVQETPRSTFCRECQIVDEKRVWLRQDGSCPRCSDPALDWQQIPEERRDPGNRVADEFAWLGLGDFDDEEPYGSGFGIVYADPTDPHYMPESESAVPGWKTLGSSEPWNLA